jgi:CheY-like chemotaxis protein
MPGDHRMNSLFSADNSVSGSDKSRKSRVLLVDDEKSIRQLFHAALTSAGYEVLDAVNGQQAMDMLESFGPDLVITDLVMPEKEGIEIIRELRDKHPQIKIIAMSGAFDGAFLKVAKALGAHATVLKPILYDDLIALVNRMLDRA